MNILWKSAVALSVTVASLGAAVVPAQAQYYGGRDGWRGDNSRGNWHRGDWRRGDRWDRRHRDDRRHWRGYRGSYHRDGYRQRCRTEWRYDRYYDQRVRVRVCR